MTNHHFSSVNNNNLINNTFSNQSVNTSYITPVRSTSPNNLDNIYLYNNIIENRSTSTSSYARCFYASGGSGTMKLFYNYLKGWSNANTSGGSKVAGNISMPNTTAALTLDADGSCNDATYCVDKGSPALQYYDIDLTRGDLGTFGGPYSIDNYTAIGTGNARVFDLDIPFEIWSGQTPQVKAESTHIK